MRIERLSWAKVRVVLRGVRAGADGILGDMNWGRNDPRGLEAVVAIRRMRNAITEVNVEVDWDKAGVYAAPKL